MRRKSSKLVLLTTGAALAWFLDPVSGRDRRRQVADQLAALTGGSTPHGDPTGGAAPPAVAEVQPLHPQPPTVGGPDLAQAVEAAAGGEKVLGSSEEPGTEPPGTVEPGTVEPGTVPGDGNRAALGATR